MSQTFAYLDENRHILIGSKGLVLDEPKGIEIQSFRSNRYLVFWDPYERRQITLQRAMALAHGGLDPSGISTVRFIEGTGTPLKEHYDIRNLMVVLAYKGPFHLFERSLGTRRDFATLNGLAQELSRDIGMDRTATLRMVHRHLYGFYGHVRNHVVLPACDLDATQARPWEHRPVVQVDYKGNILRRFDGIAGCARNLGAFELGTPVAVRKAEAAVRQALTSKKRTARGFHLRYESEHARYCRLDSLTPRL